MRKFETRPCRISKQEVDRVLRIAIIGAVGSGKTTLAGALAERLCIRHIELDSLSYERDWQEVDAESFLRATSQLASESEWIVDGNHENVRDLLWLRADAVIWLDYSFATTLRRLLCRTIRRLWSRSVLSGGNRERFRRLAGPNSVVLWAIRSYHRRRRSFELLLQQSRYRHLHVIRLTQPTRLPELVADILAKLDAIDT